MSQQTTTPATEPDKTPTDQEDSSAAPSGEGAPADGGDEPLDTGANVDPDQAALEAFSKGVATVSEPKTAADVVAKTTEAATAAPAAAPAPAPVELKAPEPDPETDKEVQDLRLKGRAEERFRELTGQVKELTPLREALAKHQITDPAKVEEVIQNAARAQEWEDTVLASTATPEQFGSALNVIKAMNADDPKLQNIAFDVLLEQVSALGRRLGREVPGLVDPLADHADLRTEVENGDLTRARALEIAGQRATVAASQARDGVRSTEEQGRIAVQQAMTEVAALSDQLKAGDPDFTRKLAILQPTLDIIRESVHPSQWRARIEKAYRALPPLPPIAAAPAPAPAPAPRVPVSHMPVRPTGTSAGMQPKPRTDLEAFQMGLRSVMRE